MTDERLDEIKTKWNIPVTLPMAVPWGKDDVVWLVQEVERLRAKVRTITEHYKPGWVDGLKAVARSAGFDPDDAPHDGVDPPTFIQDVIDLLRAENARLRAAQSEDVPPTCDLCDKLRCACKLPKEKP
jgi:hypothetical protein